MQEFRGFSAKRAGPVYDRWALGPNGQLTEVNSDGAGCWAVLGPFLGRAGPTAGLWPMGGLLPGGDRKQGRQRRALEGLAGRRCGSPAAAADGGRGAARGGEPGVEPASPEARRGGGARRSEPGWLGCVVECVGREDFGRVQGRGSCVRVP
jgi:hypothetical protein